MYKDKWHVPPKTDSYQNCKTWDRMACDAYSYGMEAVKVSQLRSRHRKSTTPWPLSATHLLLSRSIQATLKFLLSHSTHTHTHTHHTHITECEGARRTPILHKILHFVVEQSQADANNLPIYPLWATLEKGLGG